MTWVSGYNRVMALLQDFVVDLNVIEYVELPLVVHQSIRFLPFSCSVSELPGSCLLHLFEGGKDFSFLLTAFSDPCFNWIRTGDDCASDLVELMQH